MYRRRDRRERSTEPHAIGDIVEALLRERPLAGGVSLGRLAARWVDVVGAELAGVTTPAALEEGVLVLTVETAPWAAQVRFLRSEIARRANEALGAHAVREVRVRVGPTGRKPLPERGF